MAVKIISLIHDKKSDVDKQQQQNNKYISLKKNKPQQQQQQQQQLRIKSNYFWVNIINKNPYTHTRETHTHRDRQADTNVIKH